MRSILPKILILLLLSFALASCKTAPPKPFGACPTPQQVEWQKMEINMFCHFGPNTFSGAEWGDGKEAEDLFNPTHLDCRQWAKIAHNAGMGGIIITAKHH
ncbi:MAG: alpha-L-fucosidase, partial [Bacteroidales bacterium]|nr:alpha-L-fucosidase [Bacteroidales bacterium]